MKRPVHVSVVVGAVLAELVLGGCGQARRLLGRGSGEQPREADERPHLHADEGRSERRRAGRERQADYDDVEALETAYRERMRSRGQARSHQRALDRDFERELYLSDVTDWLEGRPAGER